MSLLTRYVAALGGALQISAVVGGDPTPLLTAISGESAQKPARRRSNAKIARPSSVNPPRASRRQPTPTDSKESDAMKERGVRSW